MAKSRLVLCCVVMLGVFALLAGVAGRGNAVTYDESLHLTSAYFIRHHGDFRVNPEDPPLFQRWAGLALPAGALTPELALEPMEGLEANPFNHWRVAQGTLYGRPYGEIRGYVDSARLLMLVPAVLLGGVTMALAWLLAGVSVGRSASWGVLLAGGMYCLDPSFLGHGPLVKNDVTLALSFAVAAVACVMLGRRVTAGGVLLLAAGAAVGVTSKFSGLLLGPAVALALLARAMSGSEWVVLGKVLRTRIKRAAVVAGVCAFCLLFCWAAVWAVYGFRFSQTPGAERPLMLEVEDGLARVNLAYMRHWTKPTESQAAAERVPGPMRGMRFMAEHRLLPGAYAKGFNYTYATTMLRNAYLLGEISTTGWWYYFPLVVAFKLPLGMLGLLVLAAGLGWWSRGNNELITPAVMVGFYALVAVTGTFNLGIRHLLPVMPLVYAVAAVALAAHVGKLGTWGRWVPVVLVGVLAAETLWRYPRYISFFNAPSQAYGPVRLLGDSNLDWGQDVLLLVAWQRAHPQVPLSVAYFGTANLNALGLRFTALPGTAYSGQEIAREPVAGVVAISTSHLQELTFRPAELGVYDIFRRMKPREVLGDTIFLYAWPPSPADFAERPVPLSLRRGRNVTVVTSPTPLQQR